MNAHERLNAETFSFGLEINDKKNYFAWDKQRKIHSVLERYSPKLVADVGNAAGVYSAKYLEHGCDEVEGFDISEKAIQVAMQRGFKACRWIAGSEPCPSPDHYYDAVVASEVIEHVCDTDYFVVELKRICKPRGIIIITTPNLYYWISRLKFVFGIAPWNYPGVSAKAKADPHIILEHLRINGIREWEAFFKYHGLIIKEARGFSMVNPRHSPKQRLIYYADSLMPASWRSNIMFVLQKR